MKNSAKELNLNENPSQIVELESKIAFLENNIQDLSDVVYQQAKTIGRLEKQLEGLNKRIPEDLDQLATPSDEPPPPHY